jgi:hypothetical protein
MSAALRKRRSIRQAMITATLFAPIAAGSCYLFVPHLGAAISVGVVMWISDFTRGRPWRRDPAESDSGHNSPM